jgi:hypothetical protein
MMNLTMVLGGAGSAVLAAAVGLRAAAFRPRTRVAEINAEETES